MIGVGQICWSVWGLWCFDCTTNGRIFCSIWNTIVVNNFSPTEHKPNVVVEVKYARCNDTALHVAAFHIEEFDGRSLGVLRKDSLLVPMATLISSEVWPSSLCRVGGSVTANDSVARHVVPKIGSNISRRDE
ncbi:hypothetical protein DE146DRAFT_274379 [Phaeosphaeria sp. MPI-PUGE-AT-0046c]|nr:hypothetical protein DE146DRAFT_274379 [Phaeosphaeria sp. MPI-PUGE-AT-0046c]